MMHWTILFGASLENIQNSIYKETSEGGAIKL